MSKRLFRADWYREAMKEACIPLTKEESEMLDSMVILHGLDKGKVNQRLYLGRLKCQTHVPLTRNQEKIIEALTIINEMLMKVCMRNGCK